jgi:hypothetical protein
MSAFISIAEAEDAPLLSARQKYELQAAAFRYFSVNIIFYPVQFLCVIFAMNMLLRRVADHASHRSPSRPHFYNQESLTPSQLLQ